MSLLGVVDLLDGMAVHAVAGRRHNYQPLRLPGAEPGDPLSLVQHYHRSGATGIYVADLKGILRYRPDWLMLRRISAACKSLWIDIGLRVPNELIAARRRMDCPIVNIDGGKFSHIHWIVATETCRQQTNWLAWRRAVGNDRLVVGLDLQGGRLRGSRLKPDAMVRSASLAGINQFVVLDLTAVGCRRGPITGTACQRLKKILPSATIVSGGGVRDQADMERLYRSGCSQILIASALLPEIG